jgi:hypothetical protein
MYTPPTEPASTPQPSPAAFDDASTTRDVRLVVQAVESAEEAALAYAREIGEARRHLTAAIEHLDRAEQARALLNRYTSGFSPEAPVGAPAAGAAAPGMPPAREFGGPAVNVSTPSPGIAIASPSGPTTGPRGSADGQLDGGSSHGYGSVGGSDAGSAPNPPVAPPPRPGGWGAGSGPTQ